MSNDRLTSKKTDSQSSIQNFTPPDTSDSETQTVLLRLPRPDRSPNNVSPSPSVQQENADEVDVATSISERHFEGSQDYIDLATSRALLDYIFSENIEDTEKTVSRKSLSQIPATPKESTCSSSIVYRNSEGQLSTKCLIPRTPKKGLNEGYISSQVNDGELSRNSHMTDTKLAELSRNSHIIDTDLSRNSHITDTDLFRNSHITDTDLSRNSHITDTDLSRNSHITDTELSRNSRITDTSSIRKDGDDEEQYPSLFNFLVNPSAINFFTESQAILSDDEKSGKNSKQDASGTHKREKEAKRVESWDSNLNFVKFVTSKSLINFILETDNLCDNVCVCDSKKEVSEIPRKTQSKKTKKVHFYDDGFQSQPKSHSMEFTSERGFQKVESEKYTPTILTVEKEPLVKLQYRNQQYSNRPKSRSLQGDIHVTESKLEIGHKKNHDDFASSKSLLDTIFSDSEKDSTNTSNWVSEYSSGITNESRSEAVTEKASNNQEFYISMKAEEKSTSNHKELDKTISPKVEEIPNQEKTHISQSAEETPNYEVQNFSDDKKQSAVTGESDENKERPVTKTNPVANDIQNIYHDVSDYGNEEKVSEFTFIINPCTVTYHNENINFGDGAHCYTDSSINITETNKELQIRNEAENVPNCEADDCNYVSFVTINFHEADNICHIHETTKMLEDIVSGDHNKISIPRNIKPLFLGDTQCDIAESNEWYPVSPEQHVDNAGSCVKDLESESPKTSESEELHEEAQENEITTYHYYENRWKVEEWLKRNRFSRKSDDLENYEASYGTVLTETQKSKQHLIEYSSKSSDLVAKRKHKIIPNLKETLDLARQQQIILVNKLNSLNFPWRQQKSGVAKWVKESDTSWRPKKPKRKIKSFGLFLRNTERYCVDNYDTISNSGSQSQDQIFKPNEDTVSNIGDIKNSEIFAGNTLVEQVKDAVGQIKEQINTTPQIIDHGDTNQENPNKGTNHQEAISISKLNAENSLDEINRLTNFLRKRGKKTKKHHTIFSLKELPSESSTKGLNFLQKIFKNFSRLWGFRRFGRRNRRIRPTISDEDIMQFGPRNPRFRPSRHQQQIRFGFLRRLFLRLRNYFTSTRNQHSGILHGIQRFETLQNSIRSRALPVMNEADIATHLFHRPHVCPLKHMRHCRNNTRSF